ncbi:hypothetical protein KIW84_073730 [Lathyrus oleraceus]|uniref:Uncharacterized protein n=1 Tax=Pisum sativum TaxID=3888 RepID=A0A9D4ZZ11_PEA|nr:hypothetical protein KIW84_073730 [Pisum sativum]
MLGQIPVDELLFDPEIERTARRLNSKTRRRRQQVRHRQEQGESSSTTNPPPFIPNMEPPPLPISTPCINSPRNTAQFANHTGSIGGRSGSGSGATVIQKIISPCFAQQSKRLVLRSNTSRHDRLERVRREVHRKILLP